MSSRTQSPEQVVSFAYYSKSISPSGAAELSQLLSHLYAVEAQSEASSQRTEEITNAIESLMSVEGITKMVMLRNRPHIRSVTLDGRKHPNIR